VPLCTGPLQELTSRGDTDRRRQGLDYLLLGASFVKHLTPVAVGRVVASNRPGTATMDHGVAPEAVREGRNRYCFTTHFAAFRFMNLTRRGEEETVCRGGREDSQYLSPGHVLQRPYSDASVDGQSSTQGPCDSFGHVPNQRLRRLLTFAFISCSLR
jgi:hypothetical protein